MITLIIKTVLIFIAVNIIEFLFMILFKVKKSIIANFILNNILGILMLYLMNYLGVFITNINLIHILIVSSTGVFGLIGLLIYIL